MDSITPAHPAALAGAPTFVTVSVSSECWRSCRERGRPVLELDTGAPVPSWLRYELEPVGFGYYIGNPGMNPVFPSGPPVFPSGPQDCPGWTYAAWSWADDTFAACQAVQGFKGFSVRVVADPTTPLTSAGLRLRIPDCGGVLLAPFTLDLVGAAQAPGMCAGSTGAPCSVDADCSAGGCYDGLATCDAAHSSVGGCYGHGVLPGPVGSACGCVAGICSWH